MKYRNRRAQAIVEMALFVSFVLLLLGTLISFLQRQNDQQYLQMEAFRRALQRACTYQGESVEGAGASVQYTLMQNRHLVELSPSFHKGDSQGFSAASSVFWAIPKVDEDARAASIIVYRINDDEQEWDYRDFVPEDHDGNTDDDDEEEEEWTFQVEDMTTTSETNFADTTVKEEDREAITNTRSSVLNENLAFHIPYTVRVDDKDHDESNDVIIEEGTLWDLNQRLYRDINGQYRYWSQVPAEYPGVERGRTWRTDF